MLQVLLKALFDLNAHVLELGELFKIVKFKNPIFRKIENLITFLSLELQQPFVTFLYSLDKTVIIRQGQKSDIATGKGSGANFSLYRRTHCSSCNWQERVLLWLVFSARSRQIYICIGNLVGPCIFSSPNYMNMAHDVEFSVVSLGFRKNIVILYAHFASLQLGWVFDLKKLVFFRGKEKYQATTTNVGVFYRWPNLELLRKKKIVRGRTFFPVKKKMTSLNNF